MAAVATAGTIAVVAWRTLAACCRIASRCVRWALTSTRRRASAVARSVASVRRTAASLSVPQIHVSLATGNRMSWVGA